MLTAATLEELRRSYAEAMGAASTDPEALATLRDSFLHRRAELVPGETEQAPPSARQIHEPRPTARPTKKKAKSSWSSYWWLLPLAAYICFRAFVHLTKD